MKLQKAKKRIKRIVHIAIFCFIFVIAYVGVSGAIGNNTPFYKKLLTFHDLPRNSVDVVFIGASHVHRGWNPLYAWKNYGIVSYSWATNSQPTPSIPYIIKDILLTQSPKVIVIDYNGLNRENGTDTMGKAREGALRNVTDNMTNSVNRLKAVYTISKALGLNDGYNGFTYYFSLTLYHSLWEQRLAQLIDGTFPKPDLVNATTRNWTVYLDSTSNPGPAPRPENPSDLPGLAPQQVQDVIDAVKECNVPVELIVLPYSSYDWERGRLLTIENEFDKNGLDYFDMMDDATEMGIDYSTDYYDRGHLNLWGAQKATDFLAKYLIAKYDLPDHRGELGMKAWDTAYAEYYKQAYAEYYKQAAS